MIKQSLQKIDKLIRERQYSLPEILLKLEAFLLHFSKKVVAQGEEYAASDLYAEAVKIYKNYLVQQPYKLTKVTTPAIAQAIENDSFQHLSQIFALRNRFLKQLNSFIPSDPFGRRIVSELTDLKWVKKIVKPLIAAEQLRRQTQLKKGVTSWFSELTVLLWFGQFKGEYLVHITPFLQKCLNFLKDYMPVAQFLDHNSHPYLQELCDPDKKYYITIHQCDDVLQKLRSPEILARLWQLTQEKSKVCSFQSESSMVVHLYNADKTVDQIIGVTGQKLVLAEGEERDVKLPPAVLVGSAGDCDLVLKSKYISRKQMLIIQDRKHTKQNEIEKSSFFVVCLSQTNFTMVQYPYRVKAGVGLIFFAQGTKYQVIRCERSQTPAQTQEEQDERTLSLLPSQSAQPKPAAHHTLTLLILSGQDKQKEATLSTSSFRKLTEMDGKHESLLQQHLEQDEGFFIRPQVQILAKTSNDILQGKTSRKIRLCKGMKVSLDEYSLLID